MTEANHSVINRKDGPFKIYYPSGLRGLVNGCWLGRLEIGGQVVVGMLDVDVINTINGRLELDNGDKPSALLLDPRAVVLYEDCILYEPRRFLDKKGNGSYPDWVLKWLRRHPHWPNRLLKKEHHKNSHDL